MASSGRFENILASPGGVKSEGSVCLEGVSLSIQAVRTDSAAAQQHSEFFIEPFFMCKVTQK